MALPKKGIYPHAVHFIPKDFLETLQMFGAGVLERRPAGSQTFPVAEDRNGQRRGCSDSGPLFCWRAVIAALLADKAA